MNTKKIPNKTKTATGIFPNVLALPAKVYPGESLVIENGSKNKTVLKKTWNKNRRSS